MAGSENKTESIKLFHTCFISTFIREFVSISEMKLDSFISILGLSNFIDLFNF